jgi:hypothetical protein
VSRSADDTATATIEGQDIICFATRQPMNPRACLVAHGVDVEHFRTAGDPDISAWPCARTATAFRGPVRRYHDVVTVFRRRR